MLLTAAQESSESAALQEWILTPIKSDGSLT